MQGRTCLVTGATGGIGLATARGLARQGANVILVGRNREAGRAAADVIGRESQVTAQFIAADLSSQEEVRRLAAEVRARHPRVHVLVNNAGAMHATRRETVDGIEATLALNHLAPFLLTNLLLDTLRAGSARVVTVSSEAHRDVKSFDFEDPEARRRSYPRGEGASLFYSLALPWAHPGFLQYAQSKLANILFTAELARRLEGSGVSANCIHPGVVASGFAAGNGVYGWFAHRFLRARGISPEEASQGCVRIASAPELEGVTGAYFDQGMPATAAPGATDPQAAARLWELSEKLTHLRG